MLTLLPAVDVADGKAVRLLQGEVGSETDYGSPVDAARDWVRAGAEWIHLVDLDAAFGRGSNHELLARIVGEVGIKVELSGGIRDDASLARALAAETDILLMDEAFSALDPLIRREMQDQLIDLQGKLGKTILFITHDLNEAMRLGDRIAMMRDGRVEQVGTAEEILRDPASDYVSRFVADVDRTRVLTAGSIAEPPYAVLGSDRSPRAAHKLLRENQPPWLLVQNRDRTPFGYVWEDDVARAVKEGSNALPLSTIHEMPVVSHSTPVNELFAHAAQHAAPIVVVDDDGRISGVIPRVTLLAAISEQNQEAGASSAASASSADPAAEQTDEQAGKASETTEAEGADA